MTDPSTRIVRLPTYMLLGLGARPVDFEAESWPFRQGHIGWIRFDNGKCPHRPCPYPGVASRPCGPLTILRLDCSALTAPADW